VARVTSKLQVTIPKAVADRYAIEPGAEIVFEPAGEFDSKNRYFRFGNEVVEKFFVKNAEWILPD